MTAIAGAPTPRGHLYDIGGRRLHMVCAGPQKADGPTVLLEAGAFGFSADWGVVQDKLAAAGIRSCAYDRAGLGFSDPGPKPRDGLNIEHDLEKLLAAAGEKGPFILCGHSMAGLRLRIFAARHPGLVKGVVLVDATTPEAMDNKVVQHFVGAFSNLSRLAAVGAGAGLFKPLVYTSFGDKIGLTGPAKAEKRWAFASGRHNYWAAEEVRDWPRAAQQARDAGPFPRDLPVAVITAGAAASGPRGALKSLQSAPADASRRGYVEHVDGAAHATLLGEAFADAIVRGVQHVRDAALQPA
ncbi:alpha/beta hydrolase [Caulobacter sp. KR2-114]|uniref:alpha/beta hydrolase n=1 Tax=Caulobacter sp. KR2-114 TaxID=3400912 RepID=UPI003C0931EE